MAAKPLEKQVLHICEPNLVRIRRVISIAIIMNRLMIGEYDENNFLLYHFKFEKKMWIVF